MMKEEVGRNLPKTILPGCYDRLVRFIAWFDNLLEVLIPTGRKQGRIMMDYRCRVLSSSAKSSNLKALGFSKISEFV
jgi:hypothetical protein